MSNDDFSTRALARLQQHFLIIRTPPTELSGHVSCGCKAPRHSTQGGVLVPLDPVCPQHEGVSCWSAGPLAWFWLGTFGHPADLHALHATVTGLFIRRYTGRASRDLGQPETEEVEIFKVFDDESLDAFLRAAGLP